jgi:pyrimidine-nucleoside phosphorylase
MLITEILKKKRLGINLSKEEINFIIQGILNQSIANYQAAAFLTSSCIHGLSNEETLALTFAMRDSGFKFDFSKYAKKVVDKHSTGGVGDKISLLLVPICMSFDVIVPMISGRGLGHTGGTVDKLESIIGFNIRPDKDEFYKLVEKNSAFMACQTDDIAPADKILYHLRDVTGNVESVGLITASILSKKLVEDLDVLVIDLKVGNGAFMQSMAEAEELAYSIGNVCKLAGVKCNIIFSSMDEPLGYKVGNWLEIEETIESLSGNSPPDIRELTVELASSMVHLSGLFNERNEARKEVVKTWDSGLALKNFYKMIESQGGDLEKSKKIHSNVEKVDVLANNDGYITQIDTLYTGISGIIAGAGRKTIEDRIDYSAGIIFYQKVGDKVSKNDLIAQVVGKDKYKITEAADLLKKLIIIGEEKPSKKPLIIKEIEF